MHNTRPSDAPDASDGRPVRCFHLGGGGRAFDTPGLRLGLIPPLTHGACATLSVPRFHAAYAVLQQSGLHVIGIDFYTTPEQADGRQPLDWRAFHPAGASESPWSCADQAAKWSFIAHAAFQEKQGPLWDVASRVRHQLRTCEWRLRQVSDAYWQQLDAVVRNQGFKENRRFKDGFTWLGYLALQAFLVDACVLRDHLAEYRALILPPAETNGGRPKIRLMASLKKHYLDRLASPQAVDHELLQATEPAGWLHRLSSYRDLVVHHAPLANAGKTLYALCLPFPIGDQAPLPTIKFPLPADPEVIKADRSTGAYLEDPELTYARFLNALEDPHSALDGMHYAHLTLGQLAKLAADLSMLSPVKPVMPNLTEKDMLDFKVVARRQSAPGPG